MKGSAPQLGHVEIRRLEELIFRPLETYEVQRNEIAARTVGQGIFRRFTVPAAGKAHG